MKNSFFKNKQVSAGMTLIELVVVISIFATIAGVVLFNFSGFSTNISVENLAQDIALRIKNAQTEAISGKYAPGFIAPNVPSYGVRFDTATPDTFTYFADLNNDQSLTGASACGTAGAECLEQVSIQTGDRIQSLCLNEQSGSPNCSINPNDLSVLFKRPFPDAVMTSLTASSVVISDAEIHIVSPKGKQMTIIVWSSGQISLQ